MTRCLSIARSKGSPLFLLLVPLSDFDERECEIGVASTSTLTLRSGPERSGRITCQTFGRENADLVIADLNDNVLGSDWRERLRGEWAS
jgi:hypothetical protein